MTEIYLIRHAQAEGNRFRILQGHWDGGVTALGRRQIQLLAAGLRDLPFQAVYASDLYRACLTATAVYRSRGLPLQTLPALREIHVGPWETQFFGNVLHDEPLLADTFLHRPDLWRLDGAETYAQVGERAYPALEAIARRHEGGRVAVFSHGVTIRCLLARIKGRSVAELPVCANTGITRLRWENGRFSVEAENDCSHLDTAAQPVWSAAASLRHEALCAETGRKYYTDCYRDAWLAAHGDLSGYYADLYWDAALTHLRRDPRSVLRLLADDTPVGLVDLDPERGAQAGYGWLSLLYLRPEFRGQGYGVQALARAILHFRSLGRRSLRLLAAEDNAPALHFYEREGFRTLSWEDGSHGKLLLMELPLTERRDDL